MYSMPNRLSMNLEDPSELSPKKVHFLYQACFLTLAILRGEQYRRGINADHMGMGKTHQYVAMMVLFDKLFRQDRPTTMATTNNVKFKSVRDVTAQLGHAWKVLSLGSKIGNSKHGAKVTLDPAAPWYINSVAIFGVPLRRVLIIASYTDLSNMTPSKKLVKFLHRVNLDEGHENRRAYLGTDRGKILKKLNADSRWIFTGTPIVKSLAGVCGAAYVLVVSRCRQEQTDLVPDCNQGPTSLRILLLKSLSKMWNDNEVPSDSKYDVEWDEICDCVDHQSITAEQYALKAKEAWLCGQWPACSIHSAGRVSSLDGKERLGVNSNGKVKQDQLEQLRNYQIVTPFVCRMNACNEFHRRDANR